MWAVVDVAGVVGMAGVVNVAHDLLFPSSLKFFFMICLDHDKEQLCLCAHKR